MAPRVSILIPCYQQAHYLPQAVQSALAQTRPPDEIIIINDGSTDATHAVATELAAAYPNLIRLVEQENCGLSMARQAGLDAATGDLLVALDADDLLLPSMIELSLAAFVRRPDADAVVGDAMRISDDGQRELGRLRHDLIPPWPAALERNPIGTVMAVMMRTSSVRRVGGMGLPGVRACEDWDLWARMARCAMTFIPLHAVVARYRQNPAGLSRSILLILTEKIRLFERSAAEDPRLAKEDLHPAPPISRAQCERLINGAVFFALGMAAGEGLESESLHAITDRLARGAFDVRYGCNQFLYGLQYAMHVKPAGALPPAGSFGTVVAAAREALERRGHGRHAALIEAEMRREFHGGWRKRISLARRWSRMMDAVHARG